MFEYLNSILYKSTKASIDIANLDENSEFQPYLIQRWCSMHSPSLAHIINETTNTYWASLDTNSAWYMSLNSIIPKCSFKKIAYIKKAKKELDSKEKEYLQKIATSLEISNRELINYVKDFNLNIKSND